MKTLLKILTLVFVCNFLYADDEVKFNKNSNFNCKSAKKDTPIYLACTIEAQIENDEYQECLDNSGGGSGALVCTQPVLEKYENKIKELNQQMINSIKTTKKGFFDQISTFDKKDLTEVKANLEKIYKNYAESWDKYKVSYFELINNTYGRQTGTMWLGITDQYEITFLKMRTLEILRMKYKIEKGDE